MWCTYCGEIEIAVKSEPAATAAVPVAADDDDKPQPAATYAAQPNATLPDTAAVNVRSAACHQKPQRGIDKGVSASRYTDA